MQIYSKILFVSSSFLLAAFIILFGVFFGQLSRLGLWFGILWLLILNALIFYFSVKIVNAHKNYKPHSSGILWSLDGVLAAFGLLSFLTLLYFLRVDIDRYYSSFYFWMVQVIIITVVGSVIALLLLSLNLSSGDSRSSIKKESLVKDAEFLIHHLENRFGIHNKELRAFINTIRFKLPHPSMVDPKELGLFAVELNSLAQKALLDDLDSDSMIEDFESLKGKLLLLIGGSR